MSDRDRIGHWMQTFGGRAFYPLNPRPEVIEIDDIAHALARICRFGGHVQGDWYSVAQHSTLVARTVKAWGGTPDEVFAGLMHDAAEAYLGDVIWPLKQAPEMLGYRRIEHRVEQAIAQRFEIAELMPPIVKRADLVLLATEKRDIITGSAKTVGREVDAARAKLGSWHCDDVEPLAAPIVGRPPRSEELLFLDAFVEFDAARREVRP